MSSSNQSSTDDSLRERYNNEQDYGLTIPKVVRRKSPAHKKRLDYKHQRRIVVGGEAYKKVRQKLPRIERQLYRNRLDAATRAAARNEECAEQLAEQLRSIKRSHFRQLMGSREDSLRKAIMFKRGKRIALFGRKQCSKEQYQREREEGRRIRMIIGVSVGPGEHGERWETEIFEDGRRETHQVAGPDINQKRGYKHDSSV